MTKVENIGEFNRDLKRVAILDAVAMATPAIIKELRLSPNLYPAAGALILFAFIISASLPVKAALGGYAQKK